MPVSCAEYEQPVPVVQTGAVLPKPNGSAESRKGLRRVEVPAHYPSSAILKTVQGDPSVRHDASHRDSRQDTLSKRGRVLRLLLKTSILLFGEKIRLLEVRMILRNRAISPEAEPIDSLPRFLAELEAARQEPKTRN